MISAVIDSGIAEVTIDRPPVNAFSSALWNEMVGCLAGLADDSAVSVVILTAAGDRAFSAGADIKETATLNTEERRTRAELVVRGLQSLYDFPLPIVCAINGPASGGGVNIATLCDYRIASDQAHFSLPEIRHGASAGGGAFLRRIGVPAGPTRALLFGAIRIDATTALELHLVDEVVATESLLERAREVAGEFASHGREALWRMKAAVLAAESEVGLFNAYARAHEAASEVTRNP